MVPWVFVNTDSGNGLLPNGTKKLSAPMLTLHQYGPLMDGTKPLPKPMLTFHQYSPLAFTQGQFHWKYSRYQSLNCV